MTKIPRIADRRRIAFVTPCLYRMQEDQWIAGQLIRGDPRDVSRADQASMGMADRALPLQALSPQPGVGQVEVLTAVIVLAIVDADRPSVIEDRTVFRHSIGDLRHQLGEMQRGVRIVPDAEEEHLPV